MSRLHCFVIPLQLGVEVLLVRRGVAVEVSTLVVVIFLVVKEGSGALGDPLEARQSGDISVRVDIHVLDGGWLHDIRILLLILDFLVEHLELLLVFLDAQFDAMHQDIRVNCFLGGEGDGGLFVAKSTNLCNRQKIP